MQVLMFVWSVPLQSSRTASSLQAESLAKILVNTYIATYTASCLKRLRTSTIIRRRINHNILHFVWSLQLQSSRTASSLQAESLPKILVNTYIATYTASCLKRLENFNNNQMSDKAQYIAIFFLHLFQIFKSDSFCVFCFSFYSCSFIPSLFLSIPFQLANSLWITTNFSRYKSVPPFPLYLPYTIPTPFLPLFPPACTFFSHFAYLCITSL